MPKDMNELEHLYLQQLAHGLDETKKAIMSQVDGLNDQESSQQEEYTEVVPLHPVQEKPAGQNNQPRDIAERTKAYVSYVRSTGDVPIMTSYAKTNITELVKLADLPDQKTIVIHTGLSANRDGAARSI